MSKWTVVLTGGIGSGKSLVASKFEDLGVTTIEQDQISREVVEPGTDALQSIESYFGADILNEDGTLNRPKLRQRVFNSVEERRWLERLTHPLIGLRTREHVSNASSNYAIVINPLLRSRQSGYHRFLVVDAPVTLQVARTMSRDSVSEQLAKSMIDSQIEREERLKLADDIIVNDGELAAVTKKVCDLHQKYLNFAREFSAG